MRALWLMAVSSAALAAAPAVAGKMAFEDNKLNFKSCDGASVTARWRESQFSLSEPGKSLGDGHGSFKYLSWSGTCSSVSWDESANRFLISEEGAPVASDVVRYLAPDGAKWAGMRSGRGFFVSRIASADEDASAARVQEIADWLDRTSAQYTPGADLAQRLKAAAVE